MRTGDRVIRWASTTAVLVVASIAAYTSYRHAVEVIERFGAETALTAHLIPLTVDGLAGASSMVMLSCARSGLPVPRLARWALAMGIAATLVANVLHGLSYGLLAAVIAAWPAVALVISYELTMWVVASGRTLTDTQPPSNRVLVPVATSDPLSAAAQLVAEKPAISGAEVGRKLAVSRRAGLRLRNKARALLATAND